VGLVFLSVSQCGSPARAGERCVPRPAAAAYQLSWRCSTVPGERGEGGAHAAAVASGLGGSIGLLDSNRERQRE
jgi:hypothetical protein